MNGIYIHIPFCRQKCHYCNFFSLATTRYRDEFLDALVTEIRSRKGYLGGGLIGTIYLGGGTPSLFSSDELMVIFDAVAANHQIARDAEITLEANPDDLDDRYLAGLRATPVNRLSIGVQSFRDTDLAYLNRVHDGRQAETAVVRARDHGFTNLTIDLIFGIPTLDDAGLLDNIGRFLGLGLPHLSAYGLTVEPHTALEVMIRKGKTAGVDEERAARQFSLLTAQLREHGYQHYEISNFAREGMHARHNTGYWLGGSYIGFGPSAHSYDGVSRQWNASHLGKYIEGMRSGSPSYEREELLAHQKYDEYVMVSLRTMWGADPAEIGTAFGVEYRHYFEAGIRKFLDRGLLQVKDGKVILTEAGKLHADGIASDLFWQE